MPSRVVGPYSRQHLDWLAANGAVGTANSSAYLRDFIDSSSVKQLLAAATEGAEVYFWEWEFGDENATQAQLSLRYSAATGFIAIDGEKVVGFVETYHAN